MNAILLSGGMDSIAVAAWRRPEFAITIDYGQKPAIAEAKASRKVSAELGIAHFDYSIDAGDLGSGDLAGTEALPIAPQTEWWPFRNQLLITVAAMNLLPKGVNRLLIGTVRSDGFHADGTKLFVETINNLLRLQEGEMTIEAPAIDFSSAELVERSGIKRDLLCWAHSCHTGNFACGLCRGCDKHRQTMSELGYGAF